MGRRCFLMLLGLSLVLRVSCSDVPCTKEVFRRVKRGCMNVVSHKMGNQKSSLETTCSALAHYVQCMRDNWNKRHCDTFSLHMKGHLDGAEKDLREKCPDVKEPVRKAPKQCDPDGAVKSFIECGRQFYSKVPQASNRTFLVLATLCPEVELYNACVHRSKDNADCEQGNPVLPHMNYMSEAVVRRYRTLCRTIQNAASQRTTACNRKRFINDMFLCGYHFANIAEIVGNHSSTAICPYLEKYRKCHNVSITTYGCAPPDQLHKDAEAFFTALTQRFVAHCKSNDSKRSVIARVTLNEDLFNCDVHRFLRYYFECANNFVSNFNRSNTDIEYVCRTASTYRNCVSGARFTTQCNTGMDLNSHLSYLQNYIIRDSKATCARREIKIGSLDPLATRVPDNDETEDDGDIADVPVMKPQFLQ
ncbi:uncharacterized protein LOC135389987 [Ornithodoros turicata]|uniref:uncharacterized protein LOC135389987 n=1 Tax=Ornithodoros turicata TaxID=34597 RepID=UPI0031396CC1